MKNKTKLITSLVFAASFMGARLLGALVVPDDNVYYTSFETPDYALGNVVGQDGWTLSGTTATTAAEIVVNGEVDYLGGDQMLRLKNATWPSGTPRGTPIVNNEFTDTAMTDKLYFSGVTAFSGTITENETGIISRFYLNNASNSFYGAAFGIHQDITNDNELHFFYMNTSGSAVSFGTAQAAADTFYRFEIDMDIAAKSYEIKVFDYESDSLIATSDSGVFRGDTAMSINYLRVSNSSSITTDNYETYYDEIVISSTPIPESRSLPVYLGLASFLFVLNRRRPSRSFSA
ncbi:hypothetical protein QEH59_10095 [Coraliomargarita sp. SDUM461004]|uniref:PEP-CTERM sorting domain-containing protein n=1 Tax=Thalassobacterium sedimentorum TaxID=3041258 RepID=A0ABU1AIX7_9BACT|nr:hypothetical protein [Coraliomargarita sp. SDUM461004]MDQ8194777.1 hypothetical protein [Coraliomargarita sp. SDUM461004]